MASVLNKQQLMNIIRDFQLKPIINSTTLKHHYEMTTAIHESSTVFFTLVYKLIAFKWLNCIE